MPNPSRTTAPPLPRWTKVFIVLFIVASAVDIVGGLWSDSNVDTYAKPLLLPLLIVAVVFAAGHLLRQRVGVWLLIGMVFAWFGDLALMGDGDLWFGLGMGSFLIMQICYIVALVTLGRPGLVRAWPLAAVPYALVWLGMNIWIWPHAGMFAVPVLVYSAALVLMAIACLNAVLAMRQWWIAAGGLLFVISDGLISVVAFGMVDASPAVGAVIMATYCAAQLLITVSVVRWLRTAEIVRAG